MILEHLEEQLPVGACTAVIVTFLSLFSAQTVQRLGCGILSALLVISTTGWVIFKVLTWPEKVTLEIREKRKTCYHFFLSFKGVFPDVKFWIGNIGRAIIYR